jgi:signal transduction histidine kinase
VIAKLSERLVSPTLLADPVHAFRGKVVAGLGVVLAMSGIPAGFVSMAMTGPDDPRVQISFLAAAGQLLVVAIIRRASDHRPAAVLQLLVVFASQLAFVSLDGGMESPALMWALALPVLGAMTLGRHAGWLAGGLAALEVLLVVLADRAGMPLGDPPSGAEGAFVTASSMLLLILVLGFASTLFESARRAAIAGSRVALDQLRTTHDDLVQAHELTVEASRARRDFLARVSHELRTPVHGILGTTQILLDLQSEPAQREIAGNALNSARGLLELLNDLLDVAAWRQVSCGSRTRSSTPAIPSKTPRVSSRVPRARRG